MFSIVGILDVLLYEHRVSYYDVTLLSMTCRDFRRVLSADKIQELWSRFDSIFTDCSLTFVSNHKKGQITIKQATCDDIFIKRIQFSQTRKSSVSSCAISYVPVKQLSLKRLSRKIQEYTSRIKRTLPSIKGNKITISLPTSTNIHYRRRKFYERDIIRYIQLQKRKIMSLLPNPFDKIYTNMIVCCIENRSFRNCLKTHSLFKGDDITQGKYDEYIKTLVVS